MSPAEIVFWSAIGLLAYTYVGYPLLLWIMAAMRATVPRRDRREPTVSVIVVAYNEARHIEQRLQNLLALDYPRECLHIILASDGSTDDTVERARRFAHSGVRVFAFRARRGKSAVLNTVMPHVRSEIVLLADARQRFARGSLRALVARFADPDVGAVSGELVLAEGGKGATPVGAGVGFYWRYEKFIRRHEARIYSTSGVTGAIYALRRRLFEPIPADTILDDVLIPMRIVRRGYRVVFESQARAYDHAAATAADEFARKVRTLAGNFQLFARERWLWNPFANPIWWQMLSHKVGRLLGPLWLIAAACASLALLDEALYRGMLVAQIALYAAAFIGHLRRQAKTRNILFSVPYAFCLLNWAVVVGFWRFVQGRQRVTWASAAEREVVPLARRPSAHVPPRRVRPAFATLRHHARAGARLAQR